MTRERSVRGGRAPVLGAHRRAAAADAAETSARALFERVGRARVCALLKADHPLDFRFVGDRALLALLTRAYARGVLSSPTDAAVSIRYGGTNVEVPGLGRLLLTDDASTAGYTPIAYAELHDPPVIVAHLVARPKWRSVVRDLLQPERPDDRERPLDDEALRRGLAAGLASGALALLRPHRTVVGDGPSRPAASDALESGGGDASPARTSSAVHWIEIVLVDDDGEPVGDEPYEVVLPGGERRTGRLDAEGKAKLDGLSVSGSAKVSFPAIDAREWRAA